MKNARLWIPFLAALAGSLAAAQEAARFKVIINASNPASTMKREDASTLFLNRSAKWKSMEAAPVDQSLRSPVRAAFSQDVLHQTPEGIQHYWLARMTETHQYPPPVKGSDDEVIAFVEKTAGAIGYVAEATPLPATVKVLKIVE